MHAIGRNKRALVVDDFDSVRHLLESALGRWGFEVASACDGREGLRLLSDTRFDLVLTDLDMPNMNGLELALRVQAQFPHLPVVLVTADHSFRYESGYSGHASKSPFAAMVAKPFSLKALHAEIAALVQPPVEADLFHSRAPSQALVH